MSLGFLAPTVVVAERLTIATYNVENYVSTDRMTEAGYRPDYPKPEVQKQALRTVIRRLDSDVLVLQEMGNQSYLDELCRDLKRDGLSYPHAQLLSGPDQDRHVAILSKREFTSVKSHTAVEFPYFGAKEKVKRGLLEVSLPTSSGELTLFAVHLKSRFSDRADDPQSALRRLGEAMAIRDAVLTRFPDPSRANFLILGDFNDDKSSKTLKRLQQRGQVRIARLLSVADGRGERWTHAYRKVDNYTRVDHILISEPLFAAVRNQVGRIEDGPGVLEASDHRPVVVEFEFPDT
ncbi:MAG TPA: endonuclease/exonuclease/phosphatase family protein [Opitutus sp.]|nr:endonuclease/exonuclease/phosphatase family protein [Opitutus sp.]